MPLLLREGGKEGRERRRGGKGGALLSTEEEREEWREGEGRAGSGVGKGPEDGTGRKEERRKEGAGRGPQFKKTHWLPYRQDGTIASPATVPSKT